LATFWTSWGILCLILLHVVCSGANTVELQEENLVLESAFSEVGDYDVLLRLPEGLRLRGDKAKIFLKIRII
jgi:hypothetical protein